MAEKSRVLNGTLILMLGVLALLAYLAWARGGSETLRQGFGDGGGLLYRYAPLIIVSFLAAGFVEALIPREWVRDTLGHGSGLRGILIATGAGIVTPSGPFVSMPIAAVMVRSGASAGPVVAFLSAWALLALHRFIAWEVPILGWRFALLRYGVCLVLPVLAGLLARVLVR